MGAMEVHRMWCGLKLLEKILGEIKLMLDPEDISRISMRGDIGETWGWKNNIQKAMRQQ